MKKKITIIVRNKRAVNVKIGRITKEQMDRSEKEMRALFDSLNVHPTGDNVMAVADYLKKVRGDVGPEDSKWLRWAKDVAIAEVQTIIKDGGTPTVRQVFKNLKEKYPKDFPTDKIPRWLYDIPRDIPGMVKGKPGRPPSRK